LALIIPAVKDEKAQRPIPSAWRPTIAAMASALAKRDYRFESRITGVVPASAETADQVESYIAGYGEALTELPEEAWESSVCIWMGSWWDIIVDLWTESEGRSDLVLSAQVREAGEGYSFEMQSVYVP
jgi:hypothetical protein